MVSRFTPGDLPLSDVVVGVPLFYSRPKPALLEFVKQEIDSVSWSCEKQGKLIQKQISEILVSIYLFIKKKADPLA